MSWMLYFSFNLAPVTTSSPWVCAGDGAVARQISMLFIDNKDSVFCVCVCARACVRPCVRERERERERESECGWV